MHTHVWVDDRLYLLWWNLGWYNIWYLNFHNIVEPDEYWYETNVTSPHCSLTWDNLYCVPHKVKQRFFNTLRSKQFGRHFGNDISKCIFLDEIFWFLFKFLLNVFAIVQLNKARIGLGNGFAQSRWQAVIWTKDSLVYWAQMRLFSSIIYHGPPTRYAKLWVVHAPGILGTFSRHCRLAIRTCITARDSRTCRDACRDR